MASSHDDFAMSTDSSGSAQPLPFFSPGEAAKYRTAFLGPDVAIPPFLDQYSNRFWWCSNKDRAGIVYQQIALCSRYAGRPLTQDEVDALAPLGVNQAAQYTLHTPAYLGMAAAASYVGASSFRFPLYQPKHQSFNPTRIPFLPFIRGRAAILTWHALRFVAYAVPCKSAALIFFASFSTFSFQRGLHSDPRLGQVSQGMKQQMQAKHDASSRAPAAHGPSPSPSTAPPSDPAAWSEPATPASTTQQESSSWDDDSLDDASPVAPAARRADAGNNVPGTSAWDRLRRGQRSDTNNSQQGGPSPQVSGWARLRQDEAPRSNDQPSSTPQSFEDTNQDQEREWKRYEKEQAQKQFDAMLDSERQNDSSRRW